MGTHAAPYRDPVGKYYQTIIFHKTLISLQHPPAILNQVLHVALLLSFLLTLALLPTVSITRDTRPLPTLIRLSLGVRVAVTLCAAAAILTNPVERELWQHLGTLIASKFWSQLAMLLGIVLLTARTVWADQVQLAFLLHRVKIDWQPDEQMSLDDQLHAGLATVEETRARRRWIESKLNLLEATQGVGTLLHRENLLLLPLFASLTFLHTQQLGAVLGLALFTSVGVLLSCVAFRVLVTRACTNLETFADQSLLQQSLGPRSVQAFTFVLLLFDAAHWQNPAAFWPLLLLTLALHGALVASKRHRHLAAALASENRQRVLRLFLGTALRDCIPLLEPLRRELSQALEVELPRPVFHDLPDENAYSLYVDGGTRGAEISPAHRLALGLPRQLQALTGQQCRDPIWNNPAILVDEQQARRAERIGCLVLTPLQLVLLHVAETWRFLAKPDGGPEQLLYGGSLHVITINRPLERMLEQQADSIQDYRLLRALESQLENVPTVGPRILLTSAHLRPALATLLARRCSVLGREEIPSGVCVRRVGQLF